MALSIRVAIASGGMHLLVTRLRMICESLDRRVLLAYYDFECTRSNSPPWIKQDIVYRKINVALLYLHRGLNLIVIEFCFDHLQNRLYCL
jgi:hypothetical protein